MTSPTAPTPRVVLLGASNLTMRIRTVVTMAMTRVGPGASLFVAMGYGRSYGTRSRVLLRALPGIIDCGLWDALAAAPAGPTYAIVTDVGNDIAYGAPAATITGWVGQCLDRLASHDAVTVVSLLPIASLEQLSPWRFGLLRTLFFPGRPLALTQVLDTARRVCEWLRERARPGSIEVVESPAEWYGFDPIHARRRLAPAIWSALTAPWPVEPRRPLPPARPGWWRLRTATPRQWWLAGMPLGRLQPAVTLPDGATLSFF